MEGRVCETPGGSKGRAGKLRWSFRARQGERLTLNVTDCHRCASQSGATATACISDGPIPVSLSLSLACSRYSLPEQNPTDPSLLCRPGRWCAGLLRPRRTRPPAQRAAKQRNGAATTKTFMITLLASTVGGGATGFGPLGTLLCLH